MRPHHSFHTPFFCIYGGLREAALCLGGTRMSEPQQLTNRSTIRMTSAKYLLGSFQGIPRHKIQVEIRLLLDYWDDKRLEGTGQDGKPQCD